MLIDAFDQELKKPELKLLIAGLFRSEVYRGKILSAVASARMSSAIQLQERHVPNEDVEIFFEAADVLCLPYRQYLSKRPVFLALCFGIPVVATDVGSLREFVDENTGVIATTNDAPGLALALRGFFNRQDQFDREKIAGAAKKFQVGKRLPGAGLALSSALRRPALARMKKALLISNKVFHYRV